jgi:hypothetical protein
MNQFAHDLGLQVTLGSQYAKALEAPSDLHVFLTDAQSAEHSKEQQLLSLLSAWALYRDAGFEPKKVSTTCTTADSQRLTAQDSPFSTPLPEPLLSMFKRYFADRNDRNNLQLPKLMWAQWIALAQGSNAVMPNHLLVSFLSHLDAQQRLSSLSLMSGRALWLGQQNPAWRWVESAHPLHIDDQGQLDDASQQRWLQAEKNVRILLLQRMRQLDPALGLQQLQQIWSTIDADQRESLIQQLRPTLSELDTEFLQQVVSSDRSRPVKHVGAYLLSTLPNSAFYQELSTIFNQCVQYNSSDKTLSIEISPELTKQLKDRSLNGQGAKLLQYRTQKIGDVGQCIAFLCSLFPLDCWQQLIADHNTLFEAIQKNMWHDTVFAGIRMAAIQQTRQDWVVQLFHYNNALVLNADSQHELPELMALLPAPQRELVMQSHCQSLKSGYHYDSVRLCWDQLFSTLMQSPQDALISNALSDDCWAFIQAHPQREYACAWLKDFLVLASSPDWVAFNISQFESTQQQLWQTRQSLIELLSSIQISTI